MGFGYLLLGYLIAFLLSLTAGALGVGSFALILGYSLMLLGLLRLSKYHSAFGLSKWLLLPMLIFSIDWLLSDIATLFLLPIPLLDGIARTVFEWADLALTVLFQLALLYGIRMLADSISLKKLSAAALRNTLFVGIYAMLMLSEKLSIPEEVRSYVVLVANIFNFVWIVCILWLILGCMKNIGTEGEDDEVPARTGPAWLNRINDAYERTHNKLNEQARADGEEFMRRRQEKKKGKTKKKNKK